MSETKKNKVNDGPSASFSESAASLPVALIGGSSFLESQLLSSFTPLTISTVHGSAIVYHNAAHSLFFVQRHAADPVHKYSPPHLINKRAIMAALQSLGVQKSSPLEVLVHCRRASTGPKFDESLRRSLLSLLEAFAPLSKATYCQTTGPRFETPAEIRALAQVGDIVGMTCAHEASLAQEVGIPYAVVCMVDNMANGLADHQITYEEFKEGVHRNLQTMEKVLSIIVQDIEKNQSASVSASASTSRSSVPRVDQIVHAKYILPMDETQTVYEDHAIIINKGLIIAIIPSSSVTSTYSAYTTEHFPSSVLLPGLVNCHTHTGMTLMRGYADDFALHEWLTEHIWPAEAKFVTPAFVHDSTELALAEMIRGGCTTMNDMYWHPEIITALVDTVGTRALIGLPILDFPSSWATTISEYMNKGLTLRQAYPHHDRITFAVAPHAPYTVCDENMEHVRELSTSAKTGGHRVHTHLHETKAEVEHSVAGEGASKHRSTHRLRPLHNLHRLHLVNEEFIAVHMTQVDESDIQLLQKHRAHVVHCPSSNLKLASGFCPLSTLVAAGISVGIGTDSSASNNSLDMWNEMRLAALLAKGVSGLATAVPAYKALQLATIGGAKVLGLDHVTGSLHAGKHADIIAVNLHSVDSIPLYDVVSHLVYASDREHVTDVWVQGRRLLQGKKLLTIDELKVKEKAAAWQKKLLEFKHLVKQQRAAEAAAALAAPAVLEAPATEIVNGNADHNKRARTEREAETHGEHMEHLPTK